MNRNEFDHLVLAIARAEYPQHRWSIEKGQLMSRAADGEKIQYTLANLYAQAPRDDSAYAWLKARLAVMQHMGADIQYGDWATERANIYPLVRPVGFLTRIEQERVCVPEQAVGLPACLFRWHGDLCVSAVIDKPETMVHVHGMHLADWRVSAEAVIEQAKANLAAEQPGDPGADAARDVVGAD